MIARGERVEAEARTVGAARRASPSERLLDTVVAIVAEQGLDAVTIRQVATAAGVSIGAVQHHFPTKDAMLAAAMVRVGDAFRVEIDQRVGDSQDPTTVLRALARLLVAPAPEDRPASVVWMAFVARAAVHEGTAEQHRTEWQQVEDVLAQLLAAHRGVDPSVCADDAASLLALVDGLSIAVTVEPGRVPGRRAVQLVDEAVDRLLAG